MICAVGFEPNPYHANYLQDVDSSYSKCGWNVKIMTKSGVSDKYGTSRFYSDESYSNMELGGGILPSDVNNIAVDSKKNLANFEDITLIRLSDFLETIVSKRKLSIVPVNSNAPKVIMKWILKAQRLTLSPTYCSLEVFNTSIIL